ncbi:phospholipase D delta-like [Zingiber officinale]|uniref:phospholipase D delta-like n=1 Tax=Zingiber officinale TaxID=94328 RepID=UPI001C4C01A5|nr:phospholipase D delta-like [Zingiber officinale]
MASVAAVSGEAILLHGDLVLTVIEARRLPNMDMFSEHLRRLFSSCHEPFPKCDPSARRRSHHHHRKIITSDPYVTACLGDATVARTRVINNNEDPIWNEQFKIFLAHRASTLVLHVKDNDVFGAQMIGTVSIPTARIASGETIHDWFPIIGPNGKPPKPETALHLSIEYTPVENKPEYQHGIAGDPEMLGVRDSYFPLRRGGALTLYQDAHGHGDLEEVRLETGAVYKQENCWEDICHAILEAHHLIYMVGWSIYHKVKLVREPTRPLPSAGELTLGDLLKYKSQEGVRVCMLVWDDKTSHDKFFFKTGGVMQTHDEETRKFFKHSSVICVLSPRYASNKLSIVKQQVVGTLFTHHQKCVLVDTQAFGNKRKITAFIGGLDLCDGRYDTPQHRLFSDLDTVFQNDFHNPTFSTGTKGPRQPWHDLHCKIEGPAAYDILKNFEQRWRKATKWRELSLRLRKSSRWHDDALIKLERISWILSPSLSVSEDDPSLWVARSEDSEHWHVQVFRSIDSGSVKGFPSNVQEALKMNLVCRKNLVIDKSIHTAYVKAIRSAQHFIYIENQYFIGSSYAWPSYRNPGADNLIPMELALKIASKIRAKERFAVYVVIPMWPEGDPNSNAVQEILFWQGQTMQMMYGIVAQEIRSMNIKDAHPQDYLNFFCLGKRETMKDKLLQNVQSLEKSSANLSQKFRRFMIYVHAKGMIVDDEYVMVGSANINQRSMSGSRDTEIAMGAYQPHHTWAMKKRHPHGQVYGYRMSLWAEHLGMVDDRFSDPSSLECVQFVNNIAEENWSQYTSDEMTILTGHLLRYPIKVEADGKVGLLPNQECFPDVGGKILGAPTPLPDTLTM